MLRGAAIFTTLILLATGAAAQVPPYLVYHGRLDQGGAPVTGSANMRFALYDAAAAGVLLWDDAFTVAVDAGQFMVLLGEPPQRPLDVALFSGADLWLQLEVDGEVLSPRTRIASVPYALMAGEAASLAGLAPGDLLTKGEAATPGAAVVDWANLVSIPADLSDGDDVGLVSENDPSVNALGKAPLSCGLNQIPKYDGSNWGCADDANTQLSEAQVEGFVTNGAINLAAGSTLNGASISTGAHTSSLPWASITSRPGGLDDGDDVGITAEADPQVGTLNAGQWCTSDGSAVHCTATPPPTTADPTLLYTAHGF